MLYKGLMVLCSATKQQWIYVYPGPPQQLHFWLSTNAWVVCHQYPGIFNGIGKLKGVKVKLHIHSSVSFFFAQQAWRIPLHLHKKVGKELDQLEEQGIIEKVDDLMPCVSQLVIIPKKNGDVHICVDMWMANKAINCECHPIQCFQGKEYIFVSIPISFHTTLNAFFTMHHQNIHMYKNI